MKISNGNSSSQVNQDSYASDEDASVSQEDDEGSLNKFGVSSAPSQNASQASRAGKPPIAPPPLAQRNAAAASRPSPSGGTVLARTPVSGRSGGTIPTAVALSSGVTGTKPSTGGANITHLDTLPGATTAEFTELLKEFDTGDRSIHKTSDRNIQMAKDMEFGLEQEMTGYPPDVVRFEKSQLDVQGLLVDLPLSQREFYGSALVTLSAAYKLETDPSKRLAILEKALELDGVIRNAYAHAANDPVDRVLSIFHPPMGEGYLNQSSREDVDRLERLQEDFLDASDPVERKGIFEVAVEIKERMQRQIYIAWNVHQLEQRELWEEANKEVDRILKEAEAQTDPAKRYELIGRQLFQITPGQDSLKDKVVLAFTQRMYNSVELRNKLNAWHIQVTGLLNDHRVGGPKRYTDILDNLPPVNTDYIRDLSNQYTDVLKDASHRNYSITPEARAQKLAAQIVEGVMRVLLEITPLGILGDLIPSTLPDNVRMGLEFGGMLLDMLSGLGSGKQVGRAAKAVAAAARKVEIDNLAGVGVRAAGKGLVDDAGERIVKGALADQTLSPEAKAAAHALEKRALAEAGPPVDPISEFAHEAVGTSPYQSLSNYADPKVIPGNLRRGPQPGILEDSKGDRYIELGGKVYHVRFDPDNNTWRIFFEGAAWKPQYAVRLNETTNAWEVHSNVGLMGGGPKLSDPVRWEIARLLNDGGMSRRQIAIKTKASRAAVKRIADELEIGFNAAGSLRSLRTNPATRLEAIKLLQEGELSRSDIAARLGISRSIIGRLARENKIVPLKNAAAWKDITPAIRQQVIDLLKDPNMTVSGIARKVGISRASIVKIRDQVRGRPVAGSVGRHITPAVREEIVKQLNEGASQAEVARSIGVSRFTVWRIAREKGIPAGGVYVTRPGATQEQIDQIFALRDRGKSVQEISTTVGLSEHRVRNIYTNVNADTYKRSWWETTPEKRTAVLRQLDQGKVPKDIARKLGLPLETVRGIANQQRMARDSLARELLSQGQSVEEVAEKLGVSPEYVKRLRQGVPEGTHDIHRNSEDGAVAEEMFKNGYTREDVAERLGISLWKAHSLANEYRRKTMDSVMPKQLADMVAALNDQDHTFTTGELAKATGLSEATVTVIEHEWEVGSIITHAKSPQPGPSHGTGGTGVSYEWVRPLTVDQEVQAIRAIGDGQRPRQIADELHVDQAAIERLYEEDLPLGTSADDRVALPRVETSPPAAEALSEADKLEIQKLAREQLSASFIAQLLEIPLEAVNKVLL